MENYQIAKAVQEQAEEIIRIYQSLIGSPGCSWNEKYPDITDVETDIREESLYIVKDADGKMIAAAAAGRDGELDHLPCWSQVIRNPCTLARLGVLRAYQNRGIAKMLLRHIEKEAAACGIDGVHLLVSKTNPCALALYQRSGYHSCGETRLYDADWLCYEKSLTTDTAGETRC